MRWVRRESRSAAGRPRDKDKDKDVEPAGRAPRTPATPRQRIMRLLLLIVVLDIVLIAAGTAVGGYELLSLQRQIKSAGIGRLSTQGPAMRDRLTVASAALGVARICSWPWRPVAGAIAALGGPVRAAGAVGPLLDLSADGSATAAHALDGLLPVLAALHRGVHPQGDAGERLLSGLQHGRGDLQAAADGMSTVQHDWTALDVAALPSAAQQRLRPLGRYLITLSDALTVALVAPDLLGAAQPREYLLVPQNPWDLRATGGFAGTTALLEAQRGKLQLAGYQSSTKIGEHRAGYVQPPLPLLLYEHLSNWFYRDANWSPDFPTTAALLRYFYQQDQGRLPDGVIAFDSDILGPLLHMTGPVLVPGTRVTLYPANGVQTLDHYVNSTGTINKGFAGAAYKAVFQRLRSLPASQLTDALHAVGTALKQKHLLIWLPNRTIGPILQRHDWDGSIDATRGDYLYVVDTNVHYNKINRLIDENITYRAAVQADRSLRGTLTIHYHNTAYYHSPALTNLPKPQNNTLYEDFVRVYVPLGSRLLGTSGLAQPWPTALARNKTVFAGYLRLSSLARATVTFSYIVPPNALLDPTTYHLTIQKQAGTAALPITATLTAGAPGIQVNGGASWTWQGRLDGDLALTAPLAGGTARPIPLVYDTNTNITAAGMAAPGSEIEPAPGVVLPATSAGSRQ